MSGWDDSTLDDFGEADEIRIGTPQGARQVNVPIWIVRVGTELYIRSFRGPGARWYTRAVAQGRAVIDNGTATIDAALDPVGQALRDEIDQAYRDKYGRYGDSYIGSMTSPGAFVTTMRLTPLTDKEPTP